MQAFTGTVWQILSESAFWVVISLAVGGLVHEFLPSSRFRTLLNRPGAGAMAGAIGFGALLPICSCGVIPLAISLYRSGVRLGPVMAFAAATPIINPAAVILSLALLGKEVTLAYVALGLTLPYLLGSACERWGDAVPSETLNEATCSTGCCESTPVATLSIAAPEKTPSTSQRILPALRWGFAELGPTIAFYMGLGILLAGLITVLLPTDWIETYLHGESGLALLAAGALGAVIYVCAVAHIPFVAALLGAGAAPGVAIVFLVTGTATNLPELTALYKTIGRRTVIIYAVTLILGAMCAGLAVNFWLLPGFEPDFDPLRSIDLMATGEGLQFTVGGTLRVVCALLLFGLMLWGFWRRLQGWITVRQGSNAAGDDCCSG